ncbi:SGNH/GDSL hydrolase family protein [Nocardia aurantia]|nr:SGNH/GDSL hydrolase family protein [Nocardia aurantia]
MMKSVAAQWHSSRIGAALLATGLGVGAVLSGPAPHSAASADDKVYVAMGDSFAAGAGIAPIVSSVLCSRSRIDYAGLIARQLEIGTFRDVTCGGAEVIHLTTPQAGLGGETVAPQYDALDEATTLVTVGIGGNDIGLERLALDCYNVMRVPAYSCAAASRADGHDVYADKIAGFGETYARIIADIRERSPRAEIAMVGYPTIFRPGGCPDQVPMPPADADYIEARVEQLDTVMRDAANAHGARYVDLLESTRGHDICAAPDDQWVSKLVPDIAGEPPLHPNAASHANSAKQIVKALADMSPRQ